MSTVYEYAMVTIINIPQFKMCAKNTDCDIKTYNCKESYIFAVIFILTISNRI